MKKIDLNRYIKNVPDFPKKGIQFKDITPLLEDEKVFKYTIDEMCRNAPKVDKIVSADARGFIFGAAMAYKLGVGLVIARKPHKLPRPGYSSSYALEYGENTMVISKGAIKKGEKVLVVDDVLATGGSALAMKTIASKAKAKIMGYCFLIELTDLKARKKIAHKNIKSLIQFAI